MSRHQSCAPHARACHAASGGKWERSMSCGRGPSPILLTMSTVRISTDETVCTVHSMDSNSQLLCPKGKPQPTLIRVRQRRQPQAPAHGCPQLAIPRTSAAPVRSTSLPPRARDLEVVCACWADIIIMYARMANPENSPVRDISFPTNTAAILRTTPAKQRRLVSEHSLGGRTYLTTTPLGTQGFARRSTMLSVQGPRGNRFVDRRGGRGIKS